MSVEIRVPQLGESIVEATISRWTKREGDPVSAGDTLVELETDKVNVTIEAEQNGVIERIARREGDTVAVNEVIGTLSTTGAAVGKPAAAEAASVGAAQTGAEAGNGNGRPSVAASPVAQRIADSNGVDLASVRGTGAAGRVTKEDVIGAIANKHTASAALTVPPLPPRAESAAPTLPPSASPSDRPALPALADLIARPADDSRVERVRMTRRRSAIAVNLKKALNTAAMLTTFNEVDMSSVMEVRKRRRDSFKERHGVGLGFMSFFTKAVIGALKAFPMLNAEIDGESILIKRFYDIGVAVGTEEGLVVPVVRDADRKSFADIEREVAELAVKAREGRLSLAELQGGTFTITNGGVYGSLMSTPILNYPQVAILGMHKIEERPIVVNGEIVVRPMMYLAMSYDHRIVDGSDAVRFVVRIKELIEDPEQLLLEG